MMGGAMGSDGPTDGANGGAKGGGRRWLRRLGMAAGVLAALVVLVLLGGVTYQAVAAAADRRAHPAPGRLVDVGGHRLHLFCEGEGSPTVVIDAGAGSWSLQYRHIQDRLAERTRVCAYDRAGYGWSEPGPLPRTGDRLTAELAALLEASGEAGPYVLVGHSLGGWVARLYHDRHPERVAGMVLMESAHERQWQELPAEVGAFLDEGVEAMAPMPAVAGVGLLRLMRDNLPGTWMEGDRAAAYRAVMLRPAWWQTMASESGSARETARQVEATGDLGDLPLTVLTAGRSFDAFRSPDNDIPYERADSVWLRLQDELAQLSSDAHHVVVPEASHRIHVDAPDVVVEEIGRLVERARAREHAPRD